MRLGFSGSRRGMTPAQMATVQRLLVELRPDEVRHGCCIGADAQFAALATRLEHDPYHVGYPSDMDGLTSKVALAACDEVMPAAPPLDRNQAIVDDSDTLVACPATEAEDQRSGTWATCRRAKKKGIPVRVVAPDGGEVLRPCVILG